MAREVQSFGGIGDDSSLYSDLESCGKNVQSLLHFLRDFFPDSHAAQLVAEGK